MSKAERVYVLEPLQAAWQQCLHQLLGDKTLEPLTDSIDLPLSAKPSNFDYASYEFCQRDHSLLCKMQEIECHHFAGCERVLDLGCGAGIFLQLLAEQGIDAVGVERDAKLVAYGREMGLAITEADALDFLRNNEQQFDGIYCSHFIEHLPFSALQELIELLSRCLAPGGRLLLSFPDPESIRSQLLGFWRDPEHVRYYHPELVQTLAAAEGLKLDWSSYQQQPHNVAPFQVEPQALPENLQRVRSAGQDQPRNDNKDEPKRMVQKIAAMLGLATRAELTATYSRLAALEQDLAQQYRYNQALEERTEALWQVNQTWAWNDNATLRFTK
ncbi:MAG: class I SAM-dependent methyltransferase [Cellvibrionaceae bacterium]|nr:class I SAM-dependent methyltransferase [Cellvibrionaceae bacterium]